MGFVTGSQTILTLCHLLTVGCHSVENGMLTGIDLTFGTVVYERGSNVEVGVRQVEADELSLKDAILLGDLCVEDSDTAADLAERTVE